MFNRQIEITRENESILFINAVVEKMNFRNYITYISCRWQSEWA